MVLGPAQPVARWSHLLLSGSSLPQHVMTKSAFRPTSSSPPSSQLFFIDRFSPWEKMVPNRAGGQGWNLMVLFAAWLWRVGWFCGSWQVPA